MNKKILVVEDEQKILDVVTSLFEGKGYEVYQAENGQQALEIFRQQTISLVILDLMLPDMSGEEICMTIRKKSRVPIIMLTAKVEEEMMVLGLRIGADDYIRKPFSLKELLARAEAVLRRASNDLVPLYQYTSFQNGDLYINIEEGVIRKQNERVNLTQSETKILASLMKYPNKVFTRQELIEVALGADFDGYDRTIDTHIKNLRQKLEDNVKKPVYIVTVHGKGYKFGGS